ncbi:MAG: phage terminase large subunit [Deltaproteobacteria bacterium]|nr:phage terminase large subunit [Deltaproteobacteria bacterium]
MSIISTAYAADLAARNNRDVQRIVDSDDYKKLFPETSLSGKNVRSDSTGNWQRNSDIFEIVGRKGSYRSAGIGGGITGMGGECVVKGTLVATNQGSLPIEELQVGDLVLSYDHQYSVIESKPVQAIKRSTAKKIVQIQTELGYSLEMTPEHKVWIGPGYLKAGSLLPGQSCKRLNSNDCSYDVPIHRINVSERLQEVDVYDIQVADNNNYFANNFLVHNCLIIDDPFKNREEADSATIREKVWDWYTSTFYTRLAPGGGIVIIQTRWHMDDLVGRLLTAMAAGEGDQWRVINFPAIAEVDEPHRKMGEPLHPERYTLEDMERIKRTIGSRDWAALYQQRPVPDGGQIFKKEWVQYWRNLPQTFDRLISSWDMAFKDNDDSDFVVGQVWGQHEGDYYLVDQVRGRYSFTQTVEVFKAFVDKWPEAREKLVEDKANGPAVIDTLKRRISGIIPINPEGGKTSRAFAVSPVWESGNVYIPNVALAPWVPDFEAEILQFPSAAHDDQVDAMTQALNRLINKRNPVVEISSGNRRLNPSHSWGGAWL